MGRLARSLGVRDAMLEKELGASRRRLLGDVRRGPEDRPPRLVERRMCDVWPQVAVPAAVWPLGLYERLGERVEPPIAAKAHVQARVKREPVLRGATADPSLDSSLVNHRESAGLATQSSVCCAAAIAPAWPGATPRSTSERSRQNAPRHFPYAWTP